MHWLLYILLAAVLVASLYINLVGLPGLWVMVLSTALYGLMTHWVYAGFKTVLAILVLAAIAELVEFAASGAAAKKAGASRRGLIGAIIGGILGAIFFTFPFPIIGTIFGVCFGTFLGAIVGEVWGGTEVGDSLAVGLGAAKGRLIGILLKLMFGCVILGVVLWTALPGFGRSKGGTMPTAAPSAGKPSTPH